MWFTDFLSNQFSNSPSRNLGLPGQTLGPTGQSKDTETKEYVHYPLLFSGTMYSDTTRNLLIYISFTNLLTDRVTLPSWSKDSETP